MYVLENGQKFERYRIIRMLGKSSTGISYEAEDNKLQRHVTLKLIQPWSSLPDSTRRQFFRDLQILSELSHPLLTAILNYGELNGRLYIARYFVEHGSLQEYPGRTWFRPPLEISTAIAYTQQIAQALSYIHNHGYSHGSLSFTNILALHPPQSSLRAPFMISDAGLASFIRRSIPSPATPPPVTAAPEQFRNRLTPASDQYALAVLLYFWLTGHLPFRESHVAIEQPQGTQSPSPPRVFNTDVTPAQEQAICKALSLYPQERYASIEDFMTELTVRHRYTTVPMQSSSISAVPAQQQPIPSSTPSKLHAPDAPSLYRTPTAQRNPNTTASLRISRSDNSEPFTYQLHQEETTLGHSGDSDILLDQDERTSRHHALIKNMKGCYFITDCRSTYGVYIHTYKLHDEEFYRLQNGDTIHIGGYTLIFHDKDLQRTHVQTINIQCI